MESESVRISPVTLAILLGFVLFFLLPVYAEETCETSVGKFTSIEGEVEVQHRTFGWDTASLDHRLCEADIIRVGENSRAAIQLVNHSVLRLDQNSTLRLVDVSESSHELTWLDLGRGAIYAFSRAPWRVKVTAPSLKGLIKGTEFYVHAGSNQSVLSVLEGEVEVSDGQEQVKVAPGTMAVANSRGLHLHTNLHPRNAVQWSLYYPPVLGVSGFFTGDLSDRAATDVRNAAGWAERGKIGKAILALNLLPAMERKSGFYLFRAGLFLSVGRADEARADIEEVLRRSPRDSSAFALTAILELTQNNKNKAHEAAETAVSLGPTAEGALALSYVQQADFMLKAARDSIKTAIFKYGNNALLWTRLGELELALGEREKARSSARRAIELGPTLAQAHTILGFCELADFRSNSAVSAFVQSITLDSSDPMAHLGLGLSKISRGELAEGRQAIEAAVALDANRSLLRSYLGKAYFTEKRSPLDATQYALAKQLDPLDPTPYLFDGIRKQSENQPISALRDLQKSIALNDNRAVYRGRLLLDEDRAAKGVTLARVTKDVGFNLLGQREASVSLESAPASAAAHRFLSDTYQGIRRREIARVSELLQAQLLQEVNVNPIQPSLAETNLNIFTLGGPATPGFNEFTPLFERNSAALNVNGFAGSQNTFGGEGAVTAQYNRFSFGAGGMHYQSDGWRPNNGLNQHIYDFFAQAAVTPNFNIQAEYRHRESLEGDLAFKLDPRDVLTDRLKNRSQETARLGVNVKLAQGSNLLFSYIYSGLNQTGPDGSVRIDPVTIASSNSQSRRDSHQFEGQYLLEKERFNLVAGLAHSQVDKSDNVDGVFTIANPLGFPPIPFSSTLAGNIDSNRGYLYSRLKLPDSVIWTLGFSYDDYQEGLIAKSMFNPKFGLQWDIVRDFRVRAAWLRTLKPALANNRTLEPTQVAGFNQLFDDINGTLSTRYGAGFDWRISSDLYAGGEISWRELNEPALDASRNAALQERRNEDYHTLYVYWTPTDRWALKSEFSYDLYRSARGVLTENGSLPLRAETFSVPVTVSYFDPLGWFFRLGGTFVHQHVALDERAARLSGNDSFFLLDADIGYRLPNRFGLISFGVKNLLDAKFRYLDDSYREFRDEPTTGPYFPDRIFLGKVVLNF